MYARARALSIFVGHWRHRNYVIYYCGFVFVLKKNTNVYPETLVVIIGSTYLPESTLAPEVRVIEIGCFFLLAWKYNLNQKIIKCGGVSGILQYWFLWYTIAAIGLFI